MSGSKVLVFNDTRIDRHFGCELVMDSLFRNLQARGLTPVSVHSAGEAWEPRLKSILGRHQDAVAAIINGEGTIHHGNERAWGLARLPAALAASELPAYLVNASLFDNPPDLIQALSGFRQIYLREPESVAAVSAILPQARLAADLTFEAIASRPPAATRSRQGILVTDSVLRAQREALRDFAKAAGAQWWAMRPRSLLERIRAAGSGASAEKFLRRIAERQLVVTGRFHTVTACIALRTPFLALASNTRKAESLVGEVFGLARGRVFQRPSELPSPPDLAQKASVLASFGFSADEQQAVDAYLPAASMRISTMFDNIARDVSAVRRA